MAKTLAVLYRPKTFEDVTEQKNVIGILKNQLELNECKNAYLFCGGAGTGKTTCARIFANELNKGAGVPIEIDAASNNGVENVRSIIEQAKFLPLDGQYRIYIIDECHMMSIGAWNAMLKLLEEPPARTIFIFCTTDPQKIPATILSRVQRYDFNRISASGIVARLEYICKQEGLKADKAALEFIARIAQGGMRDAISLMDKCFSYKKELTVNNISEALGVVSYTTLVSMLNFLVGKDTKALLDKLTEIYNSGMDIKQFVRSFVVFLIDISIYQVTGKLDYGRIPNHYQDLIDSIDLNDCDILGLLDAAMALQQSISRDPEPLALTQAFFIKYSGGIK